jgi:hypothetical protein
VTTRTLCCCRLLLFSTSGSRSLLMKMTLLDCVAFRLHCGWSSTVELETKVEARSPDPSVLASRGEGGDRRKLQGETRSRFRRKRYSRDSHGPSATCLRGARRLNWFGSASGQRHVFAFPCKGKAILLGLAVDSNQVARTNLIGGQQIGKRVDHMALDSALEVPCTVTLVGPFL